MKPTHGMSKTRQYRIWATMMTRCYNKNRKDYQYYGGRGIDVCEEWHNASSFLAWSRTSGYGPDLQLDRVDNSRGYSPDNCRWVTRKANGANKRNNHFVEISGVMMTIGQVADMLSLEWHVVYKRVKRGWNGDEIVAGRRVA